MKNKEKGKTILPLTPCTAIHPLAFRPQLQRLTSIIFPGITSHVFTALGAPRIDHPPNKYKYLDVSGPVPTVFKGRFPGHRLLELI